MRIYKATVTKFILANDEIHAQAIGKDMLGVEESEFEFDDITQLVGDANVDRYFTIIKNLSDNGVNFKVCEQVLEDLLASDGIERNNDLKEMASTVYNFFEMRFLHSED